MARPSRVAIQSRSTVAAASPSCGDDAESPASQASAVSEEPQESAASGDEGSTESIDYAAACSNYAREVKSLKRRISELEKDNGEHEKLNGELLVKIQRIDDLCKL